MLTTTSGTCLGFLQTVLESIAVATAVSFYDQVLVLQVRTSLFFFLK